MLGTTLIVVGALCLAWLLDCNIRTAGRRSA